MNLLQKSVAPRPKKVPVVEDHDALAAVIGRVLARAGIEAEILRNGGEAIVSLPDGTSDYVLVCSDVKLPGQCGWTILEFVRPCLPEMSRLSIPGLGEDTFPREGNRRGAVAAFRRPFHTAEIQQTLAEIFPYL